MRTPLRACLLATCNISCNHRLPTVFILATAFFLATTGWCKGPDSSSKKTNAQGTGTSPPLSAPNGPCPDAKKKLHFAVDISGNVSATGHTYEGKRCVEVTFNPVEQFVGLESLTTSTPGPANLGGASPQGGKGAERISFEADMRAAKNLPTAIKELQAHEKTLREGLLRQLQSSYSTTLRTQNAAIDGIKSMRAALQPTNEDVYSQGITNSYKGIRTVLSAATASQGSFFPSDVADANGNIVLDLAQLLEDELVDLPITYVSGPDPVPANCTDSAAVGWSAWFANATCSALYTVLKQLVDADLQAAKDLTDSGTQVTALKKAAGIVIYWNSIFAMWGLTPNGDPDEFKPVPPEFFTAHMDVTCDVLFNKNGSNAVNLIVADLTPTLTGDKLTPTVQPAFVTVTCGSPFSISAGVAFSLIEQKTFAIVKASDGKGGSVDTFGTSSDSKITPVALAVTHVRLLDWDDNKFALHGSFGIGGNLNTDANAAYFLPGASLSFWRTMFVTLGAGIGSKTELSGGYKVGDPVPSGVTIDNVTKSSHDVGFAFAISFSKP